MSEETAANSAEEALALGIASYITNEDIYLGSLDIVSGM